MTTITLRLAWSRRVPRRHHLTHQNRTQALPSGKGRVRAATPSNPSIWTLHVARSTANLSLSRVCELVWQIKPYKAPAMKVSPAPTVLDRRARDDGHVSHVSSLMRLSDRGAHRGGYKGQDRISISFTYSTTSITDSLFVTEQWKHSCSGRESAEAPSAPQVQNMRDLVGECSSVRRMPCL